MIPSDHFVRFYNEVFKALDRKGRQHLVDYWRALGQLQIKALGARFRKGGVQAAKTYWERIIHEENCDARIIDHDDWIEFRMQCCPSLSKVTDNDAGPFKLYCDHCMAWIEPVMDYAGLHAVMDMRSRTKPQCRMAVCSTREQAEAFAKKAKLVSRPYDENPVRPARTRQRRKQ